jgi:predicted nucleic acid-binding protein
MTASRAVVSDTSPLSYLVLIGRESVLPALYGDILIPKAVYRELVHPNGPKTVRERIDHVPSWLHVETVRLEQGDDPPRQAELEKLNTLDPGERRAIMLAKKNEADLLLIDERAGRDVAGEYGVPVTGIIGVLGAAAQKELIDPAKAVQDLRETSFRASADLYRWLLQKGQR